MEVQDLGFRVGGGAVAQRQLIEQGPISPIPMQPYSPWAAAKEPEVSLGFMA